MFTKTYVDRVLDPSFGNWKRLFAEDSIRVHKAHLVMLLERGIVKGETAIAIKRGIDSLEREFSPPDRIPDGVEDLYFLFERELGSLVGPGTAGFLHTARSRNDMDATIFRMVLKRRLLALLDAVLALERTLEARSSDRSPFLLYTHGQPANVSTLGHYLSAFLLELQEDAGLMLEAFARVDESPMGSCAITTTGFAIDRERVSSLLGFAKPIANSYQAIATSHWLSFPAAAGALLADDVTRLAADILHKASCEVGVATFPDELVQTSSIMPQKRNPVVLEHIRIQSGLARGRFESVQGLFRNAPYQDVNELADASVVELLEAMESQVSALSLLEETVRLVGVDTARVGEIALGFGATTTELADAMVRDFGVSFREAHGVVHAFVASGYRKDTLREAYGKLGKGALPYPDERIDEVLSVGHFIEVRTVPGGPAAEGMASVLATAAEGMQRLATAVDSARAREAASFAKLHEAWSRIC